jgi:hypothetical protein
MERSICENVKGVYIKLYRSAMRDTDTLWELGQRTSAALVGPPVASERSKARDCCRSDLSDPSDWSDVRRRGPPRDPGASRTHQAPPA